MPSTFSRVSTSLALARASGFRTLASVTAPKTALCLLLLLFGAVAVPASLPAASVIYNFSYTGVDTLLPNVTSAGTGSFTVNYTNLGPQPPTALTAFSFVMTLTQSGATPASSTFVYTLANVPVNTSVILGGTIANPLPNQIAVVTSEILGTNPAFGSVAAELNMLPAGGSILTSGTSQLGDTSGTALWTSIVTVPEPSALALLLIGLAIAIALPFRTRLWAKLMR